MSKAAARARFKAFHEREPDADEIVTVRMPRDAEAMIVGELAGVIYISQGDGKKYIHQFNKTARPVLAVSHDGRQLYALAGAYRFTERGFVDTPTKTKRPRASSKRSK